jgi:hypothetical protein
MVIEHYYFESYHSAKLLLFFTQPTLLGKDFNLRTINKFSHTSLLPTSTIMSEGLFPEVIPATSASLETVEVVRRLRRSFGQMQNLRWSSSMLKWWNVGLCPVYTSSC